MTRANCLAPVVSIVVPVYNGEAYLEKTLQSVVSQTFTNWEMLLVDDCSTDGSVDLIKLWAEKDDRIKLLKSPSNFGGPAGPRNIGVREAKASLVAFLDADDIWHPRKLELQLKVMQNERFSCTKMKDFFDDEKIIFKEIYQLPTTQRINYFKQCLRSRIPNSSVIIERELLLSYPFNEDIAYRAVEDYHAWLRILNSGVVCEKMNAPLLQYRIIAGQISGSKWKQLKKMFMVQKKFHGGVVIALFCTLTHALGAVYSRLIRKEM